MAIRAQDRASPTFKKVGGGFRRFVGGIVSAKGLLIGALGGLAIKRIAGDVLDAYAKEEASSRKLADALGLVGEQYRAQLPDMEAFADQIQSQTTVGDEEVKELAALGAGLGK
ncbi:MAG TPA: hypothetical protein VMW31_01845, partial [Devosiaceae bacterium]|nr:hypothetical protein [Devosiaceae bacterium]